MSGLFKQFTDAAKQLLENDAAKQILEKVKPLVDQAKADALAYVDALKTGTIAPEASETPAPPVVKEEEHIVLKAKKATVKKKTAASKPKTPKS